MADLAPLVQMVRKEPLVLVDLQDLMALLVQLAELDHLALKDQWALLEPMDPTVPPETQVQEELVVHLDPKVR